MKTQTADRQSKAPSTLIMTENSDDSLPQGTDAGGADSPGDQYIEAYLSSHIDEFDFDAQAIVSMINGGGLVSCPTCRFLDMAVRNPRFSLWGTALLRKNADAPTGCPVCAQVPHLIRTVLGENSPDQSDLDFAEDTLCRARCRQAETLYRLWMGAYDAATSLVFAAMAEGMNALQRSVSASSGSDREAFNTTEVEAMKAA